MNNRILIVNNDRDTMFLLQKWLEIKGYSVKYTEDADSVKGIIEEFKPLLVVVDILQRKTAETLKTDMKAGLVLLMTGYTLRSHKNDLPVDDIIEKPFNLPALEMKVSRLMHKQSA